MAALLDRLREFQASLATAPEPRPATRRRQRQPPLREAGIIRRLATLSPDLAVSFQQVLDDLDNPDRASYMGPVGEAREVLRAAIHALAPDADVKVQPWFKGDDKGKPTQAERARHAAGRRRGNDSVEAADAVEAFEAKLGSLFRTVYSTASKNLHTGTKRAEVQRIVGYVVVVLDDVLPD